MVLAALAFALALGAGAPGAWAREPDPPELIRFTLAEIGPWTYRLDVHGAGIIAPYEIAVLVSRTSPYEGAVTTLAWTDGDDDMSVHIQPELLAMPDEGCYYVRFFVRPAAGDDLKPGPYRGDATGSSASLSARACRDAAGRVAFPSAARVFPAPPAPPSEVRLEHNAIGWAVHWRDNATAETGYDPGILVYSGDGAWPEDPDAVSVGAIEIAAVPQDVIEARLPAGFRVEPPLAPGCYHALVVVYTLGKTIGSVFPGTTTISFCYDGSDISFPATGGGPTESRSPIAPSMLALAGLALAGTGLLVRRRA